MDRLAGDAADRERPQRHGLDHTLHLEWVDRDRVADPEPALEEHQQAGDHVGEEPLGGEGDNDREKGGTDDRLQPLRPRNGCDREDERECVGEVANARRDQRDRGLALSYPADHARVGDLGGGLATPLAPSDEVRGNPGSDQADQPRHEEETDDDYHHRGRPPNPGGGVELIDDRLHGPRRSRLRGEPTATDCMIRIIAPGGG